MNYLKADGFDTAIIGIDMYNERLIYDKYKMVQVLLQDMTEAEAIEYLAYNVWGAYVGENTPIYIDVMDYQELLENFEK